MIEKIRAAICGIDIVQDGKSVARGSFHIAPVLGVAQNEVCG